MTAYHSDIYAKAERMNTQCGALGQSQLGTAALLKAVRWDFRLADGLVVFLFPSSLFLIFCSVRQIKVAAFGRTKI